MAKRKPKPKFLPDLTAPSHEDLKIQALKKEQSGKGIKATKTKSSKTSDRITSDTPPVIDVTEFEALREKYKTKSAMIRALAAQSIPTNMISHTLLYFGVLSPRSAYQHVYNVLRQPLKRPK